MKKTIIYHILTILLFISYSNLYSQNNICNISNHQCRKCSGSDIKEIDSLCKNCNGDGKITEKTECHCGNGKITQYCSCDEGYITVQKQRQYCQKICVKDDYCNGNGGWYAQNFYGVYWQTCPNCLGKGLVQKSVMKTERYSEEIVHSKCNGTGIITVYHNECNGNGFIVNYKKCPQNCNSGYFQIEKKCNHEELNAALPKINWDLSNRKDTLSIFSEERKAIKSNLSSKSKIVSIILYVNNVPKKIKIRQKNSDTGFTQDLFIIVKTIPGINSIRIEIKNSYGYISCIEKTIFNKYYPGHKSKKPKRKKIRIRDEKYKPRISLKRCAIF